MKPESRVRFTGSIHSTSSLNRGKVKTRHVLMVHTAGLFPRQVQSASVRESNRNMFLSVGGVTLTNCRSVRARTQKSGMYWKGVPGSWVLLPQTDPLSGARSVQLRDAERLRFPPCDGERNSGTDRGEQRVSEGARERGAKEKHRNDTKTR